MSKGLLHQTRPCLTNWLPLFPRAWPIRSMESLRPTPLTHATNDVNFIFLTCPLTSVTPISALCCLLRLFLRILCLGRRILRKFCILPALRHLCGLSKPWLTWLLGVLLLPLLARAALALAARLTARLLGAAANPRDLPLAHRSACALIPLPLRQL